MPGSRERLMEIYGRVVELRAKRAGFALCTVVATRGSVPRKPGAKMLVFADGRQEGTIGGGAIEQDVIVQAVEALAQGTSRVVERHLTHELGMCCGGGMTVFVEVHSYGPRCIVLGCGHVGAEVALLAARCGFDVVAVDERAQWASSERFAQAQGKLLVRCEDPQDVLEELAPAQDAYVVVVTHDHGLDETLVAQVLRWPLSYLGCIGSQRKALKFAQRLEARGFTGVEIEKMRTPMGLDIGALGPEEIAVSVVAEMIAHRRSQNTQES